jgi:hypothetical protein
MSGLLSLYPAKPRKFRNTPTEVDGVRFDSKREAARWGELRLLERAGEISDLKRQQPFPMKVNGQHVCNYLADFVYRDHAGKVVVEDVKSPVTRKDPTYRLKAKLLKACHGLEVREI